MTLEDARLVHEFARAVQPVLLNHECTHLLEKAKTVGRIAYCAIADARQKARAKRHFSNDPYPMKIME